MPSFDVIRVEAHRENEALYFHGTTNPVFFKAALTALVTDTDYVSIRNDVATGSGTETEYEFYRIHFTKWRASDNSNFASATEAVDYINDAASVISGEGYIVPAGETLDFELDATGTTILLSNGDDHAVNSIRAIEGADGRVHLQNHNGTSTDYLIRWQDVTIGTVAAGTSLTSVVNALNGLFTQTGGVGTGVVPPFSGIGLSSVTISAPTASGLDIVNPTGPGRWGVQSGATVGDATHYVAAPAGSEIDRNGEYYYFDMYNDAPVIIGLATDRAVLDATPDPYGTKDSMFVWGVEFTTGVNSPTGTRGSSAGRVDGPGWVSWGTSDARDTMVNSASGAASFRVGIASGRYQLEYWDGTAWIIVATSSSTHDVTNGEDAWLLVKFLDDTASIGDIELVHNASADVAFRYIRHYVGGAEVYDYPLFSTSAEAEAFDSNGLSQVMVYSNTITPGQQYFAPATAADFYQNQTAAPSDGPDVTYTEIATNAGTAPPSYGTQTLSVDENAAVNLQIQPVGMVATTTISGAPAGWVVSGGSLVGTAPEVTGDNVANPSDEYIITVSRTNSFGSSTGTLTVTVNNLTAPIVNPITGFSWESTSTALVDSDTMAAGSVVTLDNPVNDTNRLVIDKQWIESQVLPELSAGTGRTSVYIGFEAASPNWADGVAEADFLLAVEILCDVSDRANNRFKYRVWRSGSLVTTVTVTGLTNAIYDLVFINDDGDMKFGALVEATGNDPTTYLYDVSDASWTMEAGLFGYAVADRDLYIGTIGTTMDLSTSGISEVAEPAAPTNLTSWDKAVDFSGSSERAQIANSSYVYNPMMMGATSQTVSAPAAGKTVNVGYPWATACVFKNDGNSSAQHIWNIGEGAGSSDDNIYLRTNQFNALYFGWGRNGALNEQLVVSNLGTAAYYGCYIGFNGRRLSGNDATAANLAQCFDIKLMFNNGGNWIFNPNPGAFGAGTWGTTGGRMDRAVTGDLTIGGRGTNRSYHGKVASFVTTTLNTNTDMPDSTEITKMVTDPLGWMDTYKVGSSFRRSQYSSGTIAWDTANNSNRTMGTQIYLMGDGTNDSYSNGIRNQVAPTDNNYTKLNMLGMVSNDIQTVNIPGLT